MLLLDDDDVLPDVPDEAETLLAAQLGTDRLKRIDDNLREHVQDRWLKVARVVADSVRNAGVSLSDENVVRLHVRRVKALVESGFIEGQGNLLRPRWSEITDRAWSADPIMGNVPSISDSSAAQPPG
jgi:hypothetical protein